ncbi:MAG: hypothetical protein EPN97_15285, partial [Alphaproteobacteria bacterium]
MYKTPIMSAKKPFNNASAGSKKPPNMNRFFMAAKYNEVGVLKEYLEAYDDAIAWRLGDRSALSIAAEEGNYMAVQLLLNHGAPAHEKHATPSAQPLHLAAEIDRPDIAGLLLHSRAPVDAAREGGVTPLLDAVYWNSVKAMRTLLHFGASKEKMNADGHMPLHLAAEREYPEAASLLIESGADMNAKNRDGFTPLMVAAQNGGLETARVLLRRGADQHLQSPAGETALDMALAHGDNDPEFVEGFQKLINARNHEDSLT